MGHRGKDTISPKEVMVDPKCSPLSYSQDRGHHPQAHHGCLQHRLETIQSFGRPLMPQLHIDNFPAQLEDPTLGFQRNDFSLPRNQAVQMLQGFWTCPHYQRLLITNSMKNMRAMIRRTWVGRNAKPQWASSKLNSPWSNLPKGWGSPTLVCSTSGRKYGWLRSWRNSIIPLSRDRTVQNSWEMYLSSGRQRLQIIWKHSRPGCLRKILIMPNGFGDSGRRWFWRNVQVRFGRGGRRGGKAASEQWRICQSRQAKKRVVTFQSCQIQLS